MSETKSSALIYPRLCLAYFCQFAIWGSWAGALGGYADGVLGFTPSQAGWLYSAIPLGAVIAPLFIGPIADRYFAAQKVVAFLHIIGGLALLACGSLGDEISFPVLMCLMLLSGACFMPTISLVNSIVFKHLPDSSKAPYVFVFGTFGWIVVNLFIAAFCGGAGTPNFFFVGGGVGVFLAIYALTLPNTPPKPVEPGQKSDALGLGALSLFKDSSFAIFVVCAFLASIPACNYYFTSMVTFLSQRGYPSPLALTTINQFSELIFMTALPLFIARIGLKNVLLLGMGAWTVRYLCFSVDSFTVVLIGLLLHGFAYSFLYTAAYMYADKKAPENLKASTQSLMVFLLLGVGQVLGAQMYGYFGGVYESKFTGMTVPASSVASDKKPEGVSEFNVPIPSWNTSEDDWVQYLDLAAQVKKIMGTKGGAESKSFDMGAATLDGKQLTFESLNAIQDDQMVQDGVRFGFPDPKNPKKSSSAKGTVTYTKAEMLDLTKRMTAAKLGKESVEDSEIDLNRNDWFKLQARDWKQIFFIPAMFILVFVVLFAVLGKDPDAKKKGEEVASTDQPESAPTA